MQEKSAKDDFVTALHYGAIFVKEGPRRKSIVEAAPISKMRGILHLNFVLACKERRASKWRRASITDISHSDMVKRSGKTKTVVLDSMFNNEVTRKNWKTSGEFDEANASETSQCSLIRFDALLSRAVDELITYLANLQYRLYQSRTAICNLLVGQERWQKTAHHKETIPQKYAKILKQVIPVAAIGLLIKCYQPSKHIKEIYWNDVVKKSEIRPRKVLERSKFEWIMVLGSRLSVSNSLIVVILTLALKSLDFIDFISESLGIVQDWYTLHEKSLEAPLRIFFQVYRL